MGSDYEDYRICVSIDGKEYDITDALEKGVDIIVKDNPAIDDDDLPFCDKDCSNCCDCDELDDYGFWEEDDEEYPMWGIPDIRRVVFNNPATIIFWEDNTKTVVKCMEGEKFEKYAGFIAAVAKKLFGSTSRAKAIMNELGEEQVNVEKKAKKETVAVPDLTQAFNEVVANHESIQEAVNESLAR